MSKSSKESLVFVLLAIGIVSAFAGLALVSRGDSTGWLGVGIAAPVLFIAQRSMRVVGSVTKVEPAVDDDPSAGG